MIPSQQPGSSPQLSFGGTPKVEVTIPVPELIVTPMVEVELIITPMVEETIPVPELTEL